MLVDIEPLYDTPEKIQAMCPAVQGLWATFSEQERLHFVPRKLYTGVWDGGLNPVHLVEESNLHEFVDSMGNLHQTVGDTRDGLTILREQGMLHSYGVCDGIDTLLQHPNYAAILDGPRKFTVFITEIRQAEADGEWLWNKSGPYIGSRRDAVESVWLFNIVEHRS